MDIITFPVPVCKILSGLLVLLEETSSRNFCTPQGLSCWNRRMPAGCTRPWRTEWNMVKLPCDFTATTINQPEDPCPWAPHWWPVQNPSVLMAEAGVAFWVVSSARCPTSSRSSGCECWWRPCRTPGRRCSTSRALFWLAFFGLYSVSSRDKVV